MPATKAKMMNDKEPTTIPFCVFESMADRQSHTIKRLWIMCLLLIILLVGSNGLWLWYESQWSYYEQEVEQEIENEMETDGGLFCSFCSSLVAVGAMATTMADS